MSLVTRSQMALREHEMVFTPIYSVCAAEMSVLDSLLAVPGSISANELK